MNGTYYFRHVIYVVSTPADSIGNRRGLNEAIAIYGNISFDGNGNYVISSGTLAADTGFGAPTPLSCYLADIDLFDGVAGKRHLFHLRQRLWFYFQPDPALTGGDLVYGLVSANGIFAGSTRKQ